MRYYLGIDVGNTKTQYTIADENGRIISNYRGLGANHQDVGKEEAYKRLAFGIDKLLQNTSDISLRNVDFIYLGVAGADTPDEFTMLHGLFRKLFGEVDFDFDNDGIIALKNGVEMNAGIVVTCGTGNTNFAVNEKGELSRLGGLSGALGDNLGAGLIAREVTNVATRCYDERDFPSILARKLCSALGIKEIFDLINYEIDAEMTKKINQTFFEAVEEGDGKALELSWEFTKEIIRIMEYFLLRMFDRSKPFTLALDGPVFASNYKTFMNMIRLAVNERYPKCEIYIPQFPPVLGALYFAFEKKGRLTKNIINNLKESYKTLGV